MAKEICPRSQHDDACRELLHWIWKIPITIEATLEVSSREPINEVTAEDMAAERIVSIVTDKLIFQAAPDTDWSVVVGKDWPVRLNNREAARRRTI